MITISSQLKDLLKEEGTLNARLKLEDGTYINASDDLISLSLSDKVGDEDSWIGYASSKTIDFEIFNQDKYELSGKEVELEIWVDELPNEKINFGKYIVNKDKTDKKSDTSKYTAYDYMIKADVEYDIVNEYPITLSAFLDKACEGCGIELGSTTFFNSDFVINEEPYFANQTYRKVFQAVAQLSGGFCYIGTNNKLYISSFRNSDLELTEDNSYEINMQDEYFGPINRLSIGMTNIEGENAIASDEESVEEYGETTIQINDNPFLDTFEKRETIVNTLFNNLKGIKYRPYTANYYGYFWIQAGDKCKVLGEDSVVLEHKLVINGACNINTPALTKTEIKYEATKNLTQRIINAEYRVNKAEGTITQTAQDLNEQIENFDEFVNNYEKDYQYIDGEITNVKQSVNNVTTTIAKITNEDGEVNKLNTTTVVIDIEGIKVATNESAISSLMTNDRFVVRKYDQVLLQIDPEGAFIENLTVNKYLTVGYHRIEKYVKNYEKRTGYFYNGGNN